MANQPAKGRKTPANRKKPAQTPVLPDESAAVAIDAIPPEVHAKPQAANPETAAPVIEPVKEAAKPEPKRDAPPPPVKTPAPASSGPGLLLLLLGGLLAGGIGYAAATATAPRTDEALMDRVEAQGTAIAALEDQIAAIPAVDLAPVTARQDALAADLSALEARQDDAIAALQARLDEITTLPAGDGGSAAPAIAAYEADLAALKAEIETLSGAAVAQLEAARTEAAAIEENAAAAARNAAARAALSRLQTAIESGAPLGAALQDLENATAAPAPDALLNAEEGVPTLASLQESFPDVARAALNTARREGVAGEETTGIGAFLRNQLDIRSVAPREGDDTDAILSRAEAALRSGRLADTLAEVAALPEVARAEMSDWLAQAEARADAVAAVDILSTSLNDN